MKDDDDDDYPSQLDDDGSLRPSLGEELAEAFFARANELYNTNPGVILGRDYRLAESLVKVGRVLLDLRRPISPHTATSRHVLANQTIAAFRYNHLQMPNDGSFHEDYFSLDQLEIISFHTSDSDSLNGIQERSFCFGESEASLGVMFAKFRKYMAKKLSRGYRKIGDDPAMRGVSYADRFRNFYNPAYDGSSSDDSYCSSCQQRAQCSCGTNYNNNNNNNNSSAWKSSKDFGRRIYKGLKKPFWRKRTHGLSYLNSDEIPGGVPKSISLGSYRAKDTTPPAWRQKSVPSFTSDKFTNSSSSTNTTNNNNNQLLVLAQNSSTGTANRHADLDLDVLVDIENERFQQQRRQWDTLGSDIVPELRDGWQCVQANAAANRGQILQTNVVYS